MKRTKLFKNIFIILFVLMGIEVLFRYSSSIKIMDISLLRVFLGNLFISILLSYLLIFTNNLVNKIIVSIFSLLVSIYAFVQMGFNNFIGVYMSLNTSSQLGAVVDYMKEFFASFKTNYYLVFIPFLLLLIYYLFIDKYLFKNKSDKKFVLKNKGIYDNQIRCLATVITLFIIGFLYYGTLSVRFMQNDLQMVGNKELFNNPSVPSIVVNEFGVLGFGILDVKAHYIVPEDSINYKSNKKNKEVKNRSFDDTVWQKVIDEESILTNKKISEYLINNDITDYNDYSGLFEGKNLIVIMMESANEILINEEYYPNFYKMYNEGWAFVNNYSPRNACSTGNNEFSGMTGLYTIYNNCTANVYKDNTYGTSIFNLFNEANYKTLSMHNYTEKYYYRSTIHKNLGSGTYYGVEDLDIPYRTEYRNWSSDEDFLEVAMDKVINTDDIEPFMLWLTTVSSHQPYTMSSIEGDKYLDLFEDTEYPTDLKRYMSKLKILDNAFGIMLEKLEDANILDDTVIVFYGDHYPYGLFNETINNVLDYDLDDYEVERTPLLIYNSELEAKRFSQYTSFINITPTIANLFALDYDPRMYMGSDLFSDEYQSLVVYADGSWKNEIAYYNAANGEIKYYKDQEYTLDEIKEINNKITLKLQMSGLIIKNNYYEKLNKQKEEVSLEKEDTLLASLE